MSIEITPPARKPAVLPANLDGIPAALTSLSQWGVWQFEPFADAESGKIEWDKIPHAAATGRRASSTNPETWATFARAARAYRSGGYDGPAFFLRDGGGIVGIDLDKCVCQRTGAVEEWARRIVDRLNTYTEFSPSGRGLRLFVFGRLPPRDRREGRVEMYERARFLTITGARLDGAPADVQYRQAELTGIHTEVFALRVARRNAAPATPAGGPARHDLADLDILELASRAKNGAKFRALYHAGDTSAYGSHSEADLALCGLLAFYTGPDPARIDELFRGSALFRAKWNRGDYSAATIRRALEGRAEYYRPRRSRHPRHPAHAAISFTLEIC